MAILTANSLAKFYGAQDVFSSLSFEVNRGDKIALVGPNGVGKTTLLRILCGLETPSAGSLTTAKSLRIGYLPQQASFASHQTLYNEMLQVFAPLQAQRDLIRRMEEEMGRTEATADLLARYGKAVERFEAAGGYEYESRIQRVLGGLGFGKADYEKPISVLPIIWTWQLPNGWRNTSRIGLEASSSSRMTATSWIRWSIGFGKCPLVGWSSTEGTTPITSSSVLSAWPAAGRSIASNRSLSPERRTLSAATKQDSVPKRQKGV